jgi:polyribonucleotide nucleotidyltransferase
MVEGGALEVPEADVLEALFFAHKELQVIIQMQLEMQEKIGKAKIAFVPAEFDKTLAEKMAAFIGPKLKEAVKVSEKLARRDAVGSAHKALIEEFVKADDAVVEPEGGRGRGGF